jgi:two-component sensor histidine kinase
VEAVPLDRVVWNGMIWAIPLWSERGLIGLLLLGEKCDGSLLNQEEIEIGRLEAERLLDLQASAALSAKLMELQRQRIAESQLVDRQTRRVVHDEILPRIHASLLTLSSAQPFPGSQAVMEDLTDSHRRLSRLLHDLPPAADPQVQRLGLVGAIRDYVEAETARCFSNVNWEINPAAEGNAAHLPQLEAETVYYAAREVIRNAARHGSGDSPRPLTLWVKLRRENDLILLIEDDGVGISGEAPEGGSTRQGLAIHSAMLALIGGTMTIESKPDHYTRVTLRFPFPSS